MHPIVLDIETQNILSDVNYDHKKLKVSVVGIYDYGSQAYESFFENELNKLFKKLEHASLIIGFNINKFDLPVLSSYYIGDIFKIPSLDILEDVRKSLGMRISLDDIARATLNKKKDGHGLLAINYFREGKLDKLREYCLSDVKITRELYEFGKREKKLFFGNLQGRREINVNWDNIEKADSNIDLTLPI